MQLFMKNYIKLIIISALLISCSENDTDINVKGGWEWKKTVRYKGNIPQDTVIRSKFKGKVVDGYIYKFYTENHMVWLGNRNADDSTANRSIDKGQALVAEYIIKKDTLTELPIRGTDGVNRWILRENKGGTKFEYPVTIKTINENMFTQRKIGDPNAREEIWERITDYNNEFQLNGRYSNVGKSFVFENNILIDSIIAAENSTTTADRFFVDDYSILVYNRENIDSLGNDRFSGVAYVSKLTKLNDSLFTEKFIGYTDNAERNLKRRESNNIRRIFKLEDNILKISNPSSDIDKGDYRINIFNYMD